VTKEDIDNLIIATLDGLIHEMISSAEVAGGASKHRLVHVDISPSCFSSTY
jgi:hypothetical protein